MVDENLQTYCTERQWEIMQAIATAGTIRGGARALDCAYSGVWAAHKAVMTKAALHGYAPEHDLVHPVAPGFLLKGASTLYDMTTGEPKAQWIKTAADKEQQEALFREALDAMASTLPKARSVKAPLGTNVDLLTVYPVSDHHLGMLAWGEETGGDDYNLALAEEVLTNAMQYLVATSPKCDEAAILILGDFMHYDGFQPVTPTNKHLLDADSRFPKMVRVAIRALRFLVQEALKNHAKVRLIIEIGNHDMASAVFLMECFAALYEKEDRVTVDNSPRPFHCFTFGKNMIGTHHGHTVKMDRLGMVFASDWPEYWGSTVHRVVHTGHVHHDQIKEYQGLTIESHRVLGPRDAHASNNGYRSGQGMNAIVYHREFGEVARHTVSPEMLRDGA